MSQPMRSSAIVGCLSDDDFDGRTLSKLLTKAIANPKPLDGQHLACGGRMLTGSLPTGSPEQPSLLSRSLSEYSR